MESLAFWISSAISSLTNSCTNYDQNRWSIYTALKSFLSAILSNSSLWSIWTERTAERLPSFRFVPEVILEWFHSYNKYIIIIKRLILQHFDKTQHNSTNWQSYSSWITHYSTHRLFFKQTITKQTQFISKLGKILNHRLIELQFERLSNRIQFWAKV